MSWNEWINEQINPAKAKENKYIKEGATDGVNWHSTSILNVATVPTQLKTLLRLLCSLNSGDNLGFSTKHNGNCLISTASKSIKWDVWVFHNSISRHPTIWIISLWMLKGRWPVSSGLPTVPQQPTAPLLGWPSQQLWQIDYSGVFLYVQKEVNVLTCFGLFWIWIYLHCLLCKATFLYLLNSLFFCNHGITIKTPDWPWNSLYRRNREKVGWLSTDSLLACTHR